MPTPKSFTGPGNLGMLPTVKEIVDVLDRSVIGQRQAKLDLVTAVYNHYYLLGMSEESGGGAPPRQNVLLLGPTGSGKTHLVRSLADHLNVPFVAVGAHRYTAAGYVGERVESILTDLWKVSGGVRAIAERGIVFIDEIDKIRATATDGPDVSGLAVQNALLAILDGGEMSFELDRSGARAVFDVSKVLFVCAGAFVGLPDVIRARLLEGEPRPFGYAVKKKRGEPVARSAADLAPHELLRHWENDDLRGFGLAAEFVGRFSTIAMLSELNRDELAQLVEGAEGSPLREEQERFKLHGIELVFERDAILALAAQAERLGTGARGLRLMLLRTLDHVDYRVSSLASDGIGRIVYTKACIEDGSPPRLEKTAPPPDQSAAEEIRRTALKPPTLIDPDTDADAAGTNAGAQGHLTDSSNMTAQELIQRIRLIERPVTVDLDRHPGAQDWWGRIAADNSVAALRLKLRLIEELRMRRVTVIDIYPTAMDCGSSLVRCVLEYFDGARLREWRRACLRAQELGLPIQDPPPSWPNDPLRTAVIP